MKVEPSETRTHRVEYLQVTIEVHAEKYRALERHLAERGLDFEQYIDRVLENHKRLPRTFGLDTKFTFGKYRLQRLRDVIVANPGYVDFCLAQVEGFVLDDAADRFLQEVKASIERRAKGK